MSEDSTLLREFVRDGSEAAFRQVVERYLNLVYSSAFRIVNGDAHLAQDIAQLVFLNLARKAALMPPTCVLAGWLHRDTRFTALEALRKGRRRGERERKAATMHEIDTAGPEIDWTHLRPMLDEVLDELEDDARHALLLRVFQQQSLPEVGAALGLGDDSARKRVSRALDQLRGALARRGIHSTSDALAETLGSRAVLVAPAGLLATVLASALSGATIATASAAGSSLVQLMLSSKVKLALAALALAGLITPLVLQNHANTVLRRQNAELQAQVEGDLSKPGSLAFGTRRSAAVKTDANSSVRLGSENGEILRLRAAVAALRSELQLTTNGGASTVPAPGSLTVRYGQPIWFTNLSDAGQGSPEAACQTFLWAVRNEPDRLAQLVDWHFEQTNNRSLTEACRGTSKWWSNAFTVSALGNEGVIIKGMTVEPELIAKEMGPDDVLHEVHYRDVVRINVRPIPSWADVPHATGARLPTPNGWPSDMSFIRVNGVWRFLPEPRGMQSPESLWQRAEPP